MSPYATLLAKLFRFPTKMTKKQHAQYAETLTKMTKYVTGKTRDTYIKSVKKHIAKSK